MTLEVNDLCEETMKEKTKIEVAREIAPDNSAVVLAMANAHAELKSKVYKGIGVPTQFQTEVKIAEHLAEAAYWSLKLSSLDNSPDIDALTVELGKEIQEFISDWIGKREI